MLWLEQAKGLGWGGFLLDPSGTPTRLRMGQAEVDEACGFPMEAHFVNAVVIEVTYEADSQFIFGDPGDKIIAAEWSPAWITWT